jgi:phenylacetate-CoA ligase
MLVVRGINVFPSAVREVVGEFAPRVSGNVLVRPQGPGPRQDPPLPVRVELARDAPADPVLAEAIGGRPVRQPGAKRVQITAGRPL